MKSKLRISLAFIIIGMFILNIFLLIFVAKNRKVSSDLLPSVMAYGQRRVLISGEVKFDDYKEGSILIIANSELNQQAHLSADIAFTEIPFPGKYCLAVPKNAGNVYIKALNIPLRFKETSAQKRIISRPIGPYSWGYYPHNPVRVASAGLNGIDINIDQILPTLMSTYKGPTVTVSGKIIFDKYKEGKIMVLASKKDIREGVVQYVSVSYLPSPGEYAIQIPMGIGKVYISAVSTLPPAKGNFSYKELLYGFYPHNPMEIGRVDAKDININIPSD